MTSDDVEAFGLLMHALGETFNEPVGEVRVMAYYAALEDLPIEAVKAAASQAIRTAKFFPRPAELREAVEGNPNDRAERAWGELFQAVKRFGYYRRPTFEDAALERAMRELWGSWEHLCETLPGEGPELLGWRKSFIAAYAGLDRQETHARLEAGSLHPDVQRFISGERKRIGGH